MQTVILSNTADETLALGASLGRNAQAGDVFALTGDLGTGKTILAKGIAAGLGVTDEITSPTFTLMEVYEGRLSLYHFDLYRIEKDAEFDQLFFEEYWEGDGVSVIEWAERAGGRVPLCAIHLTLQYAPGDGRRIVIEHPGDRHLVDG